MSGKGRGFGAIFGDTVSLRSSYECLRTSGERRCLRGGVGDAPRSFRQEAVFRQKRIGPITSIIRVSMGRLYARAVPRIGAVGDVLAEAGDFFGELYRAGGGFAKPEGDAGGLAVGVFDADDAGFDAADAPRGRAKEDDVAGHALDREVFVEGADEGAFGLGEHAIVGDFGDR